MYGIPNGTGSKKLGTERIKISQGETKTGAEGVKGKKKPKAPVKKIKGMK